MGKTPKYPGKRGAIRALAIDDGQPCYSSVESEACRNGAHDHQRNREIDGIEEIDQSNKEKEDRAVEKGRYAFDYGRHSKFVDALVEIRAYACLHLRCWALFNCLQIVPCPGSSSCISVSLMECHVIMLTIVGLMSLQEHTSIPDKG